MYIKLKEYNVYKFREPYQNINVVMYWIIEQTRASLPYALDRWTGYNSPEQIYNEFKAVTTYKNDPHGVELIQSLPTLLENNYHGIPGAGDCDCFTVGLLSILIANGFNDTYIVLVGNKRKAPQHIYLYTRVNDRIYILDNTQPMFNTERPYTYRQILPVK